MAQPIRVAALCLLGALMPLCLLSGCDGLWFDTYWRSELYVLIAVDDRGQMSLAFDGGGGTASGIVGPTIFSIGADAKYIVLKQHPAKDAFGHFALPSRTILSSSAPAAR